MDQWRKLLYDVKITGSCIAYCTHEPSMTLVCVAGCLLLLFLWMVTLLFLAVTVLLQIVLCLANRTMCVSLGGLESHSALLSCGVLCLEDIKTWISLNFFKCNDDKTEVMVFGPSGSCGSLFWCLSQTGKPPFPY